LDREQCREADREQARERAGLVVRDSHPAGQEKQEKRNHDGGSDQAEFLADYGEDEIGVCLGQVEQFLSAGAETYAPFAALAERDKRLYELEAGAARDRPWIKERREPLHSIRF